MAQVGAQDYDQYKEDPSLSDEAGKTSTSTSLFGKFKNKTKDQTSKLKTKLKSSSKNEDSTEEDQTNDVEEIDESAPLQNAGDASEPQQDEEMVDEDGKPPAFSPEGVDTTPTESGDGLSSGKDTETVASAGGDSEQKYASPDVPFVSEQTKEADNKLANAGKSWSQWAAEKVGYAKETAAANVPTTTEQTQSAAAGVKDAVNEQVVKPAYDQGVAAKDTVSEKAAAATDQSSVSSDPAQQTYVQKATSGMYAAKNSLFSSTHPGEEDKALSQVVTETVGNLPGTIKSSLGFGAETHPSAPTTTPVLDDSPTSPSDETVPPQSPSLVSRFTSLFIGKKPEDSTPSEPAISEKGTETPVSEATNLE